MSGLPPLDEQIISVVIRVTNGNYRKIERALAQIGHLIKINGLDPVAPDFVDATRDTLVIGKYSIRMSKQSSGPLSVTRPMRKAL